MSIGFATCEMADAVASLFDGTIRSARNEVTPTFVKPTAQSIANWAANAVMITRAADDGRGGSNA